MSKTIADMFREQGRVNKARQILLKQLQLRFGALPVEFVAIIDSTTDESQLDAWLRALATAHTLAQVGIHSPQ
jgi:hypothetical protein